MFIRLQSYALRWRIWPLAAAPGRPRALKGATGRQSVWFATDAGLEPRRGE
jgi:hypothetical protein